MSVTSMGSAQRVLHSEDLNVARWQRGGLCPHWKAEWLPSNTAEQETSVQEKTSCQTQAWTKVSEEMDGFGKAAKG